MAGFSVLHVTDAVGIALSRLGFAPTDPYLGEIVPTAARGNNLVVVTPPAALHAVPGIAGALSAMAGNPQSQLLILVPEAALSEWESVLSLLLRDSGHRFHAVRSLARATRHLLAGGVQVLLATPDAALALAQRSALKLEQVTSLLLAWPEAWDNDGATTQLMQDLGRDIQRIVYTTQQEQVNDLVERYARRALTVAPSIHPLASPTVPADEPRAKSGNIRTVITPWIHRGTALKEVLELLDPATSAIWTLTDAIEPALAVPAGVEHWPGRLGQADLVIAYDLPTSTQLGQLAQAGPVVLLVPPTGEQWVSRVVPAAKPIRLAGAADHVASQAATRRAQIATVLEADESEAGLLALAPMFERYDPARVAAALYQLWQDRPDAHPMPVTPTSDVMNAATARVWLGVGKKDGATANDFVGVMTKEIRFERSRIGKIEVRELYSLVEVPASDAEMLVGKLNGVTIRRRRITARIDRGGKVRADKS
ncbi:MAG: DbpA RNA binding domain-containing protein [Gemmatimonadota bacterium]